MAEGINKHKHPFVLYCSRSAMEVVKFKKSFSIHGGDHHSKLITGYDYGLFISRGSCSPNGAFFAKKLHSRSVVWYRRTRGAK